MSWRFSGTEAHTLVKRWLLQRATETFKTCQTFSFGSWCATIFNSSLSYHLINHMQQSGQKCCWWMGVWNFKSHCGKVEILIFNPTFFSCFDCSSAVLSSFISIIVSIRPAFVFDCPCLFCLSNQPSLAVPSEGCPSSVALSGQIYSCGWRAAPLLMLFRYCPGLTVCNYGSKFK